jgi:ribosome-associated protein YbcJ (S4-like RNA binding protein)
MDKDETRTIRDKTGREIKKGDLLKVFHFVSYGRRRKIYMHKLVVSVDDDMEICATGQYLYAVDVVDIARKLSLSAASKCPLSVVGECEIVGDSGNGIEQSFWERKRHEH